MTIEVYDTLSPLYAQELALRQQVLRYPLGMDLMQEDLSRDLEDFHIGITENGKLVSTLMLRQTESGTLQMRQVCTMPSLQGKGYGRRMVQAAEDFARTRGYQKIVLHGRQSAAGFYRKLGYQTDETVFYEIGIPHLAFEKKL